MDITQANHNRIVIANPDLAGLFAAHLLLSDGFDITLLLEKSGNYEFPQAKFPFGGTFFPSAIINKLDAIGLPAPVFVRADFPIRFYLGEDRYLFNPSDGPGGLKLLLSELSEGTLPLWIEKAVSHSKHFLENGDNLFLPEPGTNYEPFDYHNSDSTRQLLDFLSIVSTMTFGMGIDEISIDNIPVLLAGLLSGWHYPKCEPISYETTLVNAIQSQGVKIRRCDSIEQVTSDSNGNSATIILNDGDFLRAEIISFPWNDRFLIPGADEFYEAIYWRVIEDKSGVENNIPYYAVIWNDLRRPPINDNFIAATSSDNASFSFPLEQRFMYAQDKSRLEKIERKVIATISNTLNFEITADSPSETSNETPLTVPGNIRALYHQRGYLYGDTFSGLLRRAEQTRARFLERFSITR